MTPVVNINQIANGYVVTVYGPPSATTGVALSQPIQQFCADKTACANFLIAQLVPGATFTPPAPTQS